MKREPRCREQPLLPVLVLSLTAMLGACPDDSGGGGDAGDGGITLLDRGSPDSAQRQDQGGADLASDATDLFLVPDGLSDFGVPVDAAPSKATVLYTVSKDTDEFGLWTVSSDGSDTPTPVPGWGGFIDFDPLLLSGRTENPPVNRGVARVTAEAHQDFQGLALPGGLGTLYYFHRKLLGTSGLLRVGADGTVTAVLEVTGLYPDTLAQYVALAQDGKQGAVVQGADKVLLFRTDGGTFPGGNSWVDVTGGAGVKVVRPQSLAIAGGWVYCTASSDNGDKLYRAPLDGSGTLAAVTLPASGGAAPLSVGDRIVVAPDASVLLVAAGASTAQRDVYVVQTQSGAATNLTKSPGEVVSPSGQLGMPVGGLAAVSPTGKRVAFLRTEQGIPELYVSDTAGGAAVQVTSNVYFQSAVVHVMNLYFADDDNLVFMAGVTTNQLDVYRWDGATDQAQNLTGHGSITTPFSGYGAFTPRAAWVSPGGGRLFWVEYNSVSYVSDLHGVDLSSWKLLTVTQDAVLPATAANFAACPGQGALYFVAQPDVSHNNREVYALDQATASKAKQISAMGTNPLAYWYVFDLTLSADCSRLVWSAGGGSNLRQLYASTPSSSAPPTVITAVPQYMDRSLATTPDGATVVFGSGGADGSATLKAVALVPNAAPVTLDPKAGTVHIFAVY